MKKKRLACDRKYESWSSDDWKKVIFNDETHFSIQGYRAVVVRKITDEPVRAKRIQQTVKYPPKKMFWGYFTSSGLGSLVPVEGMMNSLKCLEIIKRQNCTFHANVL